MGPGPTELIIIGVIALFWVAVIVWLIRFVLMLARRQNRHAGAGSRTEPAEQDTMQFPTKRVAADCLICDPTGRFLVVEPTDKRTWDLPGGVAETDESPHRAARREVAEELGVDLDPGALLAVDWVSRDGDVTEVVAFLFDGGVVGESGIDIDLQTAEIRSARFVTLAEADRLLDTEAHARVAAALGARAQLSTAYLENGRQVALAG